MRGAVALRRWSRSAHCMAAGAAIAPRSAPCHSAVLLLDDGPEMERAPRLAPGKSGVASRCLDDFGIARVVNWGDRRDSHPDLLVHIQKL
jgi:hypothetical protein